MDVDRSPSPDADLALHSRVLDDAGDRSPAHIYSGARLYPRSAVVLPGDLRPEIDSGISGAARHGGRCRPASPQEWRVYRSGRSATALACADGRVLRISGDLPVVADGHEHTPLPDAYYLAHIDAGAAAAHGSCAARADGLANRRRRCGGQFVGGRRSGVPVLPAIRQQSGIRPSALPTDERFQRELERCPAGSGAICARSSNEGDRTGLGFPLRCHAGGAAGARVGLPAAVGP